MVVYATKIALFAERLSNFHCGCNSCIYVIYTRAILSVRFKARSTQRNYKYLVTLYCNKFVEK